MHCEHCGAAMRLDRNRDVLVCPYCGAECVPASGDDGVQILGPTSRKCPLCTAALWDGLIESHALLYCTPCHGMLLAMDTFSSLIADLRAHRDRPAEYLPPRDGSDSDRHLHCPQCGREMDAHPYGGGGNVNIDSCEVCALIWLDRKELRKIVVAPDHEPLYLKYGDEDPRRRK